MAKSNPNLLYIHSDQHTPYVLGCYGDSHAQTPNLDALAARGTLFTNTYCPSPICVPSRMSALTGLHPYQNEVWNNSDVLSAGIPTLAHSMGAAGYHPVLIGRMHSNGPDQHLGYAERLVGDHGPNYPGDPRGPGRGGLERTAGPHRISIERSGAGINGYEVHDDDVTTTAEDWLKREGMRRKYEGKKEPFCLTLGYMLPHPPYVCTQEDFDEFHGRLPEAKHVDLFNNSLHPFIRWWRSYGEIESVEKEDAQRARASYYGMVRSIDRMIGRVFRALEDSDLAQNTLIVYTSDHGEMNGERALWWKHVMYEASVKVPLIMSWPGVLPEGHRSDRVVSSLDTTATLLDALGAPALPNSPGRSLLPLCKDPENVDWQDVAYSEYCSDHFCPRGGVYHRMIRDGRWKFVYYHRQPPMLFDLEDDPDEREDLASSAAHEEIRNSLTRKVLADWDPEAVIDRMALQTKRTRMISAWVKEVLPDEPIRWKMTDAMNRLF